jgi:hypothetical protein
MTPDQCYRRYLRQINGTISIIDVVSMYPCGVYYKQSDIEGYISKVECNLNKFRVVIYESIKNLNRVEVHGPKGVYLLEDCDRPIEKWIFSRIGNTTKTFHLADMGSLEDLWSIREFFKSTKNTVIYAGFYPTNKMYIRLHKPTPCLFCDTLLKIGKYASAELKPVCESCGSFIFLDN